MKKNWILRIILAGILMVIFNAIFMVNGFENVAVSSWVSYGFMHLAFALMIATPFLTKGEEEIKIIGVAIHLYAFVYFLIAFAIGVIFVLLNLDNVMSALVIQMIIAGIYGIVLIIGMIINESKKEKKIKTAEDNIETK